MRGLKCDATLQNRLLELFKNNLKVEFRVHFKKSAVNKHFHNCSGWQHIVGLLQMNEEEVDPMALQINAVRENTKIIKKTDNWLKLAFLESILIKENQPELNKGIKSCKDLALF